jgi:hypothetical protein
MKVKHLKRLLEKLDDNLNVVTFDIAQSNGFIDVDQVCIAHDVGCVGIRYSFDIIDCVFLDGKIEYNPDFVEKFKLEVVRP